MHSESIADTSIKHTSLMHSQAKKLHLHMFDKVDTAFSYERELNVCSFFKGKRSSLHLFCNAHTALWGRLIEKEKKNLMSL